MKNKKEHNSFCFCLNILFRLHPVTLLSPATLTLLYPGPLVFKGGYHDACTRKHVKIVVFFQQSMYALTLKGVKNNIFFGGVCFSILKIVISVYGIILTAEIKIKKIITLLKKGILNSTMHYLLV